MQGDYNWYQNRLGKFTGSEIHKLMGVRGLGDTGMTYIYEKVAETLTGEPKIIPTTREMYWGNENEPFAKEYYQLAFNCKIKSIDFYTCDKFKNDIGCSPDGEEENSKYGIEIKCPFNSSNHIKYMTINDWKDLKEVAKKQGYYWQILLNIYCSGLKYWKFISFDPRFSGKLRMYVVDIYPDKKEIEFMEKRIIEAINIKNDILKKIRNE